MSVSKVAGPAVVIAWRDVDVPILQSVNPGSTSQKSITTPHIPSDSGSALVQASSNSGGKTLSVGAKAGITLGCLLGLMIITIWALSTWRASKHADASNPIVESLQARNHETAWAQTIERHRAPSHDHDDEEENVKVYELDSSNLVEAPGEVRIGELDDSQRDLVTVTPRDHHQALVYRRFSWEKED